jgi:cell surface protein SprA
VISDRFSKENPNAAPTDFIQPDGSVLQGYKEGYGPKSQDVLIPSFLAAYQGKNANTVNLNPFKSLPLPNWRFTYNGLTNFAWAKKVFTSFSITHSYNSTMSINSFETNLQYLGDGYTNSKLKDTLSNNYFAQYRMPNIVLNESFQPLIGIRMTFKNTLTIDFDYKKSRIMTMSFTDYQLNEIKSETFTFGAGYKLKGLKFALFKIKGKPFKLENDFNFRFDFSIRDNVTVSHRIDQDSHIPTVGSKVISISPSIDYTVSKRVNLRFFFDYNRTVPKTSASFPITNMQGGLKLRLSLNPN